MQTYRTTRSVISGYTFVNFWFVLAVLVLPAAYAQGFTSGQQPQVLVILDTSQGMAGNLQGAIMSGSGTVAANANSASPVCYIENGYNPRSSLGPSNGSSCPTTGGPYAPYTVSVNGMLTDNSESMINVAEQGLVAAFTNPQYSNVFQMGLMDYATNGTPTAYSTWVYYMSNNNSGSISGAFSYGTSATVGTTADPLVVANPCYNAAAGVGCNGVQNVVGSGLEANPYLYIADTSDDPIINDVLYMPSSNGYPPNFVTDNGPNPSDPYTAYNLTEYEDQVLGRQRCLPPNGNGGLLCEAYNGGSVGGFSTSPTDAGYIPYSGEVWYAQRGYAYDGNPVTSGNQGQMIVAVAPLSTSLSPLQAALAPEEFPLNGQANGAEIVAGSEYAPMAGALNDALTYFTSTNGLEGFAAPTPVCAPKFVILITDGQPTMGTGGHIYPPLGSASANGYGEVLSSTGATNNDNAVTEAISAVTALYNNTAGSGPIETFVLGVGPGVNCPPTATNCSTEASEGYTVLQKLATAGGTNTVYSAESQNQFQQAFDAILNHIEGQLLTSNGGSSSQVSAGSYEYALQSTSQLGEGNLAAFAIQTNGQVASTESWDVNAQMSTSVRANDLYSNAAPTVTGVPGALTLITAMDSTAFGSLTGTGLTVQDIENYTITPSYNNDIYLGGRGPNWYVGITDTTPPLVLGPPNDANLLSNSTYVSYAQAQSARAPIVIFADNDGFLYAVNAQTGALQWGWMPRPLVQDLQNYQTFWQNTNMAGGFRQVDAQDGNGVWWTYLVGAAEQGAIEYALQLSDTAGSSDMLNAEAWEQDNTNQMAPNTTVPVIYRTVPSSGTAYVVDVLNTSSGATASTLVITDVGTGVATTIALPFIANSQAYIDTDGNIYIGDNAGNVWEGSLISARGGLATSITWTPLNNSTTNPDATNFGSVTTSSGGSGAITYVGGATYNGTEYLRIQSAHRLTVLIDGTTGWAPLWSSFEGGSETFTNGAYVSSGSVPALPANSLVTDPALIVNGSVVLPVSVTTSGTNSCSAPGADYYLYSLDNGAFPYGAFTDGSGNAVTAPVQVGTGNAFTPSVAIFNGQVRLQGAAQQNMAGKAGLGEAGFTNGPPPGGPSGWREIFLP